MPLSFRLPKPKVWRSSTDNVFPDLGYCSWVDARDPEAWYVTAASMTPLEIIMDEVIAAYRD